MPVYSHSRLSAFETCPLQYKLRYLDKIKSEEEGIEAFLGSRFHAAMEKLYGDLKIRVHSLAELLEFYEQDWAREFHDAIVVARAGRTADDYRLMGRTFIADYYKRHQPFDQSRVLGLEQKIFVDLDGSGKYRLMGYIDRLAQAADGTYEIHDYKTSNSLPEQKKLDEDRQLALYQIGVEAMWRDVDRVRLIWHYVAFDKDLDSTRTRAQLDALRMSTIGLIETIEKAAAFEPCESALCDWCPYWELCPAKKHLARIDALPPSAVPLEEGVRLVDAFAERTAAKKNRQSEIEAIEAELEEIRGQAVALARREGYETLRGSGHILRIKSKDQVTLFPKGSEERSILERELRAAGAWDAVSTVDAFALERAVAGNSLDPALMARLDPVLKRERRMTVTLSKMKEDV
jgi:putative RecB family exonuclease